MAISTTTINLSARAARFRETSVSFLALHDTFIKDMSRRLDEMTALDEAISRAPEEVLRASHITECPFERLEQFFEKTAEMKLALEKLLTEGDRLSSGDFTKLSEAEASRRATEVVRMEELKRKAATVGLVVSSVAAVRCKLRMDTKIEEMIGEMRRSGLYSPAMVDGLAGHLRQSMSRGTDLPAGLTESKIPSPVGITSSVKQEEKGVQQHEPPERRRLEKWTNFGRKILGNSAPHIKETVPPVQTKVANPHVAKKL